MSDSILLGAPIAVIMLAFFVLWITNTDDVQKNGAKLIAEAKEEQKANPDKNSPRFQVFYSQFLQYVNTNHEQNKKIYSLTLITIFCGFVIIISGWISYFYIEQQSSRSVFNTFPALTMIAGVITEFIAATILFVYRSVSHQTAIYFKSLERLTTIGAAVQIVDDIADDQGVDKNLKNDTKADIAKKILEFSRDSSMEIEG